MAPFHLDRAWEFVHRGRGVAGRQAGRQAGGGRTRKEPGTLGISLSSDSGWRNIGKV